LAGRQDTARSAGLDFADRDALSVEAQEEHGLPRDIKDSK
jgi:hypothetical protein